MKNYLKESDVAKKMVKNGCKGQQMTKTGPKCQKWLQRPKMAV